jgi:4-amino-4-deoxy-L-arabinose transferase-like glycosyltransferase
MRSQSIKLRWVAVCGLLLVMALELVHVARATSSTWDEPHHLFDGYWVGTQHDYRLNAEVPPLVKLWAALPTLGMKLKIPAAEAGSSHANAFLVGKAFVFGNGADRVLFPARMACAVLTLGLGVLIFLAGKEMFGVAAGMFGLGLYVFDPNFLANGALVTTDVGSALFFLASIYAFYRYCREPGWRWLAATGVAAGLLLAAKYTGVFVAPMLVLLAVWEGMLARSWQVVERRAAAVVAVGLMAWVVVWAFYGFRYKAAPQGRELNPPLAAYLDRMYDQRDAKVLRFVAAHQLLPEGYLWGLENTKQTEFEDTSYFWGRVERHGTWKYFPVAFLIKSTLPFLIFLMLAPVAWVYGLRGRVREIGFLVLPAAVYFGVAMASDFDIGARHLLPVYALLYVLVGGVAGTLLNKGLVWSAVMGALVAWQVGTSLSVAQAYMAYGNEAWGGPKQVHRYLSDANVDWGQQLKDVKRYIDQHHVTNCWFAYFPDGSEDPSDYGIDCKRLPTTDNLWWMDLPMNIPPVIDGTVFISDGDLEQMEFGDGPELNPYDSFRGKKPSAVIDYGVYAYDGSFPVPLARALWEAHEAGKLEANGVALAEDAVRLAPDSAVVRMQLGDSLMAAGRRSEALASYETALRLAETVRPDLQADSIKGLKSKIAKASGP